MDLATLKALKPTEYSEAADGYRSTSDMASAAKDRIDNQIAVALRNQLKGKAATAAGKQLGELSQNFHYVQVQCGLVSTALEAFSYETEAAKRKLDTALENAKAANLTVNSDGSVTYPPGGKKGEDGKTPDGGTVGGLTDSTASAVGRQAANFDPNPHHRLAQDCADLIATALKEATEADEKWAPKLRALKADDDLTVSDSDWADTAADTKGVQTAGEAYLASLPKPPEDGDPEANAEWWEKLTSEEQDAYVSMRPDSIGAMNGLPSTVRDEANRMVLAESRGEYQLKLDTWMQQEPVHYRPYISPITGREVAGAQVETEEWKEWNEKKQDLEGRIRGMDAIQRRFDMTGSGGLPEAYLLGFDPEGEGNDGKVILANGNPDTADHTAIYVPGTGTLLQDIEKDTNRAVDLWREADKFTQGEKVSTITWFDYDAPLQAKPFDKGGGLFPEAMSDEFAEKGAPNLQGFLDGSRAAHQAASGPNNFGHTTLMGHSYGTTLIGDAAKTRGWPEGPLPVDDVIAVGSPGMQADHAADLGIRSGHMWAMKGGGDDELVRAGGKYVAGLGDNWTIPTDPEFGANILESDAADHGAFWDEGSVSLRNQALVISGQYDKVTLE